MSVAAASSTRSRIASDADYDIGVSPFAAPPVCLFGAWKLASLEVSPQIVPNFILEASLSGTDTIDGPTVTAGLGDDDAAEAIFRQARAAAILPRVPLSPCVLDNPRLLGHVRRPPPKEIRVKEKDWVRIGDNIQELRQHQVPPATPYASNLNFRDAFDLNCRTPQPPRDPWRDLPNPEHPRPSYESDLKLNQCLASPQAFADRSSGAAKVASLGTTPPRHCAKALSPPSSRGTPRPTRKSAGQPQLASPAHRASLVAAATVAIEGAHRSREISS